MNEYCIAADIADQEQRFWKCQAKFTYWMEKGNTTGMLDQFERMRFWYEGIKETEQRNHQD